MWWRWYCGEEDKEAGFITIEQPKARNSKEYSFRVGVNARRMQFFDVDQEDKDKPKSEKEAKSKYKDTDRNIDMDEEEF